MTSMRHGVYGIAVVVAVTTAPSELAAQAPAPAPRRLAITHELNLPIQFPRHIPLPGLALDSAGHYIAVGGPYHSVLAWDSSGKAIQSSPAQIGEPRGLAVLAVLPGDSIWALTSHRQVTIYSPAPALSPVRSYEAPFSPSGEVIPLGGRRLLVNGAFDTQERVGIPLHITDVSGNTTLSFGEDSVDGSFSMATAMRRTVAVGRTGIFVAQREGPVVHFSLDGKRRGEFDVRGAVAASRSGVTGADLLVTALAVDGEGRSLRALLLPAPRRGARQSTPTPPFEGLLAEYDLLKRTIVAVTDLPATPLRFLGKDRMVLARHASAQWSLEVWKVSP